MNWEVTEDCPWLEVYPHTGISTYEPNYVTLNVDITGLVYGICNCSLIISSPNAANSPRTVAITLYDTELLHVPIEVPTIQDAIDYAANGVTVIVADGVYTGTGNRDIDFLGKAITVRSENGPNNCVIDCNGEGRGFEFRSGEDANSVLAGFTITNSRGAIRCLISSPKITNCTISGNTSREAQSTATTAAAQRLPTA